MCWLVICCIRMSSNAIARSSGIFLAPCCMHALTGASCRSQASSILLAMKREGTTLACLRLRKEGHSRGSVSKWILWSRKILTQLL